MAFKSNGSIIVTNDRAFDNLANVTIQNSGNLTITSADTFQGTVAGYSSGGGFFAGGNYTNIIDKFPFASNTNASDVGDLTQARCYGAGQSSVTHGYTSGGFFPPHSNTIDKFPFSVDTNASDVGDMTIPILPTGQSSSTNGYTGGGTVGGYVNTIQKFPFATDTNAKNIGTLTQARGIAAGHSSTVSGYVSGGYTPNVNTIDKFSFATDANATDVGDLTQARIGLAGQSSTTHGYSSGGELFSPPTPTIYNTIDRFPFASDTNASDVGDLTVARFSPAGQSSTVSGYSSGGITARVPTQVQNNTIDKFPFASNTNASDVGDLTQTRGNAAGQQD